MNAPTAADLVAFARDVEADAAFAGSEVHGALHRRAVAGQALWLAEHLGLSRRLRVGAFAFGAVHDSQRLHDGHDPGHGATAALWLKRWGWPPASVSRTRPRSGWPRRCGPFAPGSAW